MARCVVDLASAAARLRLVAWLALLAPLVACRTPPGASAVHAPSAPTPPPTVVVLSLDGFRHDYPARVDSPAFARLAREGAWAGRLEVPFPSLTFPSHATLATGTYPDRHGIVANAFIDREMGRYSYTDDPRWYDVSPLWIHVTRSGLRAHVFHWVSSAGAYQGVEPAVWRPYDRDVTDDEKLEAVAGWLALDEAQRPALVMSYLRGCDHDGHVYGPESEEVTRCIRKTDARFSRFLGRIARWRERVALFVVSDHGMFTTTEEVNAALTLRRAGIQAQVIGGSNVAHAYLDRAGGSAALGATAALSSAASIPRVAVHRRGSLPPALRYDHPRRIGDLVLVAPPGVRFNAKISALTGKPTLAGFHGGDPTHPQMGAIFYAWGAGVRAGARLQKVHAIDLVPTVCTLLGVPIPRHAEGRVLRELLMR